MPTASIVHTNAGKGLLQYALITKSRMSLNFTLDSITENPTESGLLIQSRNDRVLHNPIDAPSRSLFYFIHDPHVQDVTPGLSRTWCMTVSVTSLAFNGPFQPALLAPLITT